MLFSALSAALPEAVAQGRLTKDAPMAQYTTFRVGGPADVLLNAGGEGELLRALECARALHAPVTLIGNGSNLLVRDGGIRGLTVRIASAMADITVQGCTLTAGAGATLAALARAAANASLTGLEFASGIPGTLGGALAMNAGAYGGEMAQVTTCVRAVNDALAPVCLSGAEMDFAYRRSAVLPRRLTVVQATLTLTRGVREEIIARMESLNAQRREKQPLTLPSAGSTFKRPEGFFAAKLIDDAGLRGLRSGGAQVSEKHTGFVVNAGQATATDILNLMGEIQSRVYAHSGVMLEPEVRILGEDNPA